MTTRTRKVFTATTVDTDDLIPIEVELTNAKGETKKVEFAAWGSAPADATMVLTRMARVTDAGVATIDGSGMADFMDHALAGDGPTIWRELIADPDWKLRAEIIGDVVTYIQEEWGGRPTPRSSSSSPGRPTTSEPSTEPAS